MNFFSLATHKFKLLTIAAALLCLSASSCNGTKDPEPEPPTPVPTPAEFSKGADISWVTEMEAAGHKFYNKAGTQMECYALMKSLGMNTIRLRAWVNPTNGWCGTADLLVKAQRAKSAGMRIMIDFHYSDSWADPGQQTIPEAWKDYNYTQMLDAVSNYTKSTLTTLKSAGIDVEWVQVGNETNTGMLWPMGQVSNGVFSVYAGLNNAGYDAVKAVYPNALVVVQHGSANKNGDCRWLFDGLKNAGGKWDVIGLSAYPYWSSQNESWQTYNNDAIANAKDLISRYSTPVFFVECGYAWDEAATSKAFLSDLITRSKAIADNKCLGVLYWEPQCNNNWNGYSLGAFDNSGRPTEALDAFAN